MRTYVDPRGPLALRATTYELVLNKAAPTIGLLSNSFEGCDRFLDAVQIQFERKWPKATVRRYAKAMPSDRLSDEEADRIALEVDGLIAAYGH